MPTTLKPFYLDFPQSMTVQKVLEERLSMVPLSDEEKAHLENFLRKLEWAVDGWKRDHDKRSFDEAFAAREAARLAEEKADEQPSEPPTTGEAQD